MSIAPGSVVSGRGLVVGGQWLGSVVSGQTTCHSLIGFWVFNVPEPRPEADEGVGATVTLQAHDNQTGVEGTGDSNPFPVGHEPRTTGYGPLVAPGRYRCPTAGVRLFAGESPNRAPPICRR